MSSRSQEGGGANLRPAETVLPGLWEAGSPQDSGKLSQGSWDDTMAEGGQERLDLYHMCQREGVLAGGGRVRCLWNTSCSSPLRRR